MKRPHYDQAQRMSIHHDTMYGAIINVKLKAKILLREFIKQYLN